MSEPALTPRPALYAAAAIADAARPAAAPGVAIVMRTRERPLLLPRALASVAAQTWPHWRLHLVNDGGDPAPVEAAVAALGPGFAARVTTIHLPARRDMARSLNAALRQAGEHLVAVHDDDDSWEPGYLAATAGFLAAPEHARFAGVSTGCTLIEERILGERIEEVTRHVWPHARGTVDLRRAITDLQLPPIALTFRRTALDLVGGQDEDLTHVADLEFLYRLLLAGEIGFIDRPLANYHHRQRGTSGAAGNSVVEMRADRAEEMLRLRNGVLRTSLTRRPEMFGLLQPLLLTMDEDRRSLEARLAVLDARLAAQQELLATQEEILRRIVVQEETLRRIAAQAEADRRGLFARAWQGLLPARRVIARLRGRVSA